MINEVFECREASTHQQPQREIPEDYFPAEAQETQ